jgi:acyl carrier protein
MDKAALSNEIKEIIIRELKLEGREPADIDERAPLFGDGLGLDSLDALQLAMVIEEKYEVKIPDGGEERRIFASVDSIADFIARAREAAPLGRGPS